MDVRRLQGQTWVMANGTGIYTLLELISCDDCQEWRVLVLFPDEESNYEINHLTRTILDSWIVTHTTLVGLP